MIKKALTIAGSDSGGGAGIQADIKTFTAFGVYGMSALTAITAQNTIGVQAVFDLPVEIIAEQIKSIADDMGADAVKTGMLSSPAIVNIVADSIEKFNLPNVVVDPVMVAKSGDSLLSEAARSTVKERMLPIATVITPNLFEAETLLGRKIRTIDDMKAAAVELKKSGCKWVVVKGGHLAGETEATDVAYDGKEFHLLKSPHFNTLHTHGTGCTFSSAIAAGLAKCYLPLQAIEIAKEYISAAIQGGLAIGKGRGPTNHLVGVKSRW
jgi:hydroxymethylpyrimidine/phosphomethylpyrimidine kinase